MDGASRKASPERGGARRKRAEGFVPQRWLVAAALSAAVTSSQKQKNAPIFHGCASSEQELKPIPSRSSGGSAREGKDSHSRQWRLSMAVFLNRNKRPQAAPIEVAELLSEKPPPSQNSIFPFYIVPFMMQLRQ